MHSERNIHVLFSYRFPARIRSQFECGKSIIVILLFSVRHINEKSCIYTDCILYEKLQITSGLFTICKNEKTNIENLCILFKIFYLLRIIRIVYQENKVKLLQYKTKNKKTKQKKRMFEQKRKKSRAFMFKFIPFIVSLAGKPCSCFC